MHSMLCSSKKRRSTGACGGIHELGNGVEASKGPAGGDRVCGGGGRGRGEVRCNSGRGNADSSSQLVRGFGSGDAGERAPENEIGNEKRGIEGGHLTTMHGNDINARVNVNGGYVAFSPYQCTAMLSGTCVLQVIAGEHDLLPVIFDAWVYLVPL